MCYRVHQDVRAGQGEVDEVDQLDNLDLTVFRDQSERTVTPALEGQPEQLEHPVDKDRPVTMVPPDYLEHLDPLEHQEREVTPEPRDPRDLRDPSVK